MLTYQAYIAFNNLLFELNFAMIFVSREVTINILSLPPTDTYTSVLLSIIYYSDKFEPLYNHYINYYTTSISYYFNNIMRYG